MNSEEVRPYNKNCFGKFNNVQCSTINMLYKLKDDLIKIIDDMVNKNFYITIESYQQILYSIDVLNELNCASGVSNCNVIDFLKYKKINGERNIYVDSIMFANLIEFKKQISQIIDDLEYDVFKLISASDSFISLQTNQSPENVLKVNSVSTISSRLSLTSIIFNSDTDLPKTMSKTTRTFSVFFMQKVKKKKPILDVACECHSSFNLLDTASSNNTQKANGIINKCINELETAKKVLKEKKIKKPQILTSFTTKKNLIKKLQFTPASSCPTFNEINRESSIRKVLNKCKNDYRKSKYPLIENGSSDSDDFFQKPDRTRIIDIGSNTAGNSSKIIRNYPSLTNSDNYSIDSDIKFCQQFDDSTNTIRKSVATSLSKFRDIIDKPVKYKNQSTTPEKKCQPCCPYFKKNCTIDCSELELKRSKSLIAKMSSMFKKFGHRLPKHSKKKVSKTIQCSREKENLTSKILLKQCTLCGKKLVYKKSKKTLIKFDSYNILLNKNDNKQNSWHKCTGDAPKHSFHEPQNDKDTLISIKIRSPEDHHDNHPKTKQNWPGIHSVIDYQMYSITPNFEENLRKCRKLTTKEHDEIKFKNMMNCLCNNISRYYNNSLKNTLSKTEKRNLEYNFPLINLNLYSESPKPDLQNIVCYSEINSLSSGNKILFQEPNKMKHKLEYYINLALDCQEIKMQPQQFEVRFFEINKYYDDNPSTSSESTISSTTNYPGPSKKILLQNGKLFGEQNTQTPEATHKPNYFCYCTLCDKEPVYKASLKSIPQNELKTIYSKLYEQYNKKIGTKSNPDKAVAVNKPKPKHCIIKNDNKDDTEVNVLFSKVLKKYELDLLKQQNVNEPSVNPSCKKSKESQNIVHELFKSLNRDLYSKDQLNVYHGKRKKSEFYMANSKSELNLQVLHTKLKNQKRNIINPEKNTKRKSISTEKSDQFQNFVKPIQTLVRSKTIIPSFNKIPKTFLYEGNQRIETVASQPNVEAGMDKEEIQFDIHVKCVNQLEKTVFLREFYFSNQNKTNKIHKDIQTESKKFQSESCQTQKSVKLNSKVIDNETDPGGGGIYPNPDLIQFLNPKDYHNLFEKCVRFFDDLVPTSTSDYISGDTESNLNDYNNVNRESSTLIKIKQILANRYVEEQQEMMDLNKDDKNKFFLCNCGKSFHREHLTNYCQRVPNRKPESANQQLFELGLKSNSSLLNLLKSSYDIHDYNSDGTIESSKEFLKASSCTWNNYLSNIKFNENIEIQVKPETMDVQIQRSQKAIELTNLKMCNEIVNEALNEWTYRFYPQILSNEIFKKNNNARDGQQNYCYNRKICDDKYFNMLESGDNYLAEVYDNFNKKNHRQQMTPFTNVEAIVYDKEIVGGDDNNVWALTKINTYKDGSNNIVIVNITPKISKIVIQSDVTNRILINKEE